MIKGKINIKKVLSLLLLTCILVGLIGCGEKPAKQQPTAPETALSGFSVGYSMVDITPKEATPLRGFDATQYRISNDVQYPLKATCVVLTGSYSTETMQTLKSFCEFFADYMTGRELGNILN